MTDALPPPPAAAPSPTPPSQELLEESRLGGSEAARAVNLCLLALSRTARAFTLYDARNLGGPPSGAASAGKATP